MGEELEKDQLAGSSADAETAESLIGLAAEIKKVLVPVEPGLGFREWLRDQLSAVLRRRLERRVVELAQNRHWAFVLGAALISLFAFLGVVTYFLCSRLIGRPQRAAFH